MKTILFFLFLIPLSALAQNSDPARYENPAIFKSTVQVDSQLTADSIATQKLRLTGDTATTDNNSAVTKGQLKREIAAYSDSKWTGVLNGIEYKAFNEETETVETVVEINNTGSMALIDPNDASKISITSGSYHQCGESYMFKDGSIRLNCPACSLSDIPTQSEISNCLGSPNSLGGGRTYLIKRGNSYTDYYLVTAVDGPSGSVWAYIKYTIPQ